MNPKTICKQTHEKQKMIKKTRTELAETLQNAAANWFQKTVLLLASLTPLHAEW